MLDLPDPAAARAFAFEEPCYQAGAYRDVLLRRWRGASGRSMWDHPGIEDGRERYLVLGFSEPATEAVELPTDVATIVGGPLLSDDGTTALGAAVLLDEPGLAGARTALAADGLGGLEVHRWRPGGRPS